MKGQKTQQEVFPFAGEKEKSKVSIHLGRSKELGVHAVNCFSHEKNSFLEEVEKASQEFQDTQTKLAY